MLDEKVYRIKTKDGAHLNEKVKDDGSRSAIQFDDENGLQGPVDLIEVDESDFIREKEVYIEKEYDERSFGQIVMEDAITPVIVEAITDILSRAVEAGVSAFGNWMSQKVIPAAIEKGEELVDKAKDAHATKKAKKIEEKKQSVTQKRKRKNDRKEIRIKNTTVVHSPAEVEQIINNMKFAALYIAAGIRELSNTVVFSDDIKPEMALEMQGKLKELSSEEVMKTIEFMLEDPNRDILDRATIQLFEAFRHSDLIVDGETVPISKYINKDEFE